jgi:23S rRNA pseudouridine1911/1915/1917 synthase
VRYPIVGDPVYGGRLAQPKGASERLRAALQGFKRQALHAASLGFDHPRSGVRLTLESPLPGDYANLLMAMREDAA